MNLEKTPSTMDPKGGQNGRPKRELSSAAPRGEAMSDKSSLELLKSMTVEQLAAVRGIESLLFRVARNIDRIRSGKLQDKAQEAKSVAEEYGAIKASYKETEEIYKVYENNNYIKIYAYLNALCRELALSSDHLDQEKRKVLDYVNNNIQEFKPHEFNKKVA